LRFNKKVEKYKLLVPKNHEIGEFQSKQSPLQAKNPLAPFIRQGIVAMLLPKCRALGSALSIRKET